MLGSSIALSLFRSTSLKYQYKLKHVYIRGWLVKIPETPPVDNSHLKQLNISSKISDDLHIRAE